MHHIHDAIWSWQLRFCSATAFYFSCCFYSGPRYCTPKSSPLWLLNTITFFHNLSAGMEKRIRKIRISNEWFGSSLAFQFLSSVCHAFSIITPSIQSTKKKSCAARRSVRYYGDLQQCHKQPMAALGAPLFKWGSHTLHKWRLRGKNRSMGLHKVLGSTKTPPTPTERIREQEIELHNITASQSLWESLNYLASFKKKVL